MAPAFDSLSIIVSDWLPTQAVHAQLWRNVSSPFVLVILCVSVNRMLLYGEMGQKRMRHAVICLLWFGVWQVSCTRMETVEKVASARQAADSGKPGSVSATTGRAPKSVPAPTPQGLPIPTFSPQSGTVAFGTKVNLSVSNLPAGASIEYSYDAGKTWMPGDQATVLGTEPVLSRTRINDLTSHSGQAAFTPYYRRMLVVGNSIMDHAPLPAKGWFNHNGMAASAPDKDFVHLLKAHLAKQYPQVTVRLASAGNFERQFFRSDYSLDEFNEHLQQFKPDLIIVRLGENIDESEILSPRSFESQFRLLLDRLATYGGQPARIICTTSVWRRPNADAIIRRVAREKGVSLVDLSGMVNQEQYFSFGQYKDAGVGAHPNDAGMKRIADLIQEKLP